MLKEISPEIRPAFPLGSYRELKEDKISIRLPRDLAFYAIEQGERPPEKRTAVYYYLVENGKVIAPGYGRVNLNWETKVNRQESTAFIKASKYFVREEKGIVCWFSPASEEYGYPESRIVVSLINQSEKKITNFALCGDFSFDNCREIIYSLLPYSPEKYPAFTSEEILRSTPIFLNKTPENKTLWGTLKEKIPLPKAWEEIESGRAATLIEETIRRCQKIEEEIEVNIAEIKLNIHLVLLGAEIERALEKALWSISAVGPCGYSNMALLSLVGLEFAGNYQIHHSLILQVNQGEAKVISYEQKTFVKECPHCHCQIKRFMTPGEKCPGCGRVFPGACGCSSAVGGL